MLTLVDEYGGVFLVLGLAIFEIVTIVWIYGLENICLDIEFMTKRHIGFYWRICWAIITPLCMIFLFVYALISYENPTYAGKTFPEEYYGEIPLFFFFQVAKKRQSLNFSYSNRLVPLPHWDSTNPSVVLLRISTSQRK